MSDASQASRGRLTIFLGYAAGVGKTYQMLTEAHALRQRGVDVVIGYFEPHERPDTIALARGLEFVPLRVTSHRGVVLEEMDTDAILRRRPAVVVVDEFPHSNVPGSMRPKRWEDVRVLLDAGIDVLTTMNVQHVESLNDQIWQSTGVRVRETVPDWILKEADEIVLVDLTPQALLNRLARGVIYGPVRARAALSNFFKEGTLVALRELSMRQAAHAIQTRLSAGAEAAAPAASLGNETRERLLLLVGPDPATAALIRRGRRVADYLDAECFAVCVTSTPDFSDLAPDARERVQRHLNFARGLQIETRLIEGRDTAEALVGFARLHDVSQIFVVRDPANALRSWFAATLVQRVVTLARDRQVTVVADRSNVLLRTS